MRSMVEGARPDAKPFIRPLHRLPPLKPEDRAPSPVARATGEDHRRLAPTGIVYWVPFPRPLRGLAGDDRRR